MSVAARTAVDPAAVIPPRVGLLASARELNRLGEAVDTPGARWEAGFALLPEGACPMAATLPSDTCSDGDPYPSKVVPTFPTTLDYEPFVVYGVDECGNFDRNRDRDGRARRALVAGQSAAIARELWRGTLAQAHTLPNPYLAQATPIAGAPLAPLDALAALESVYVAAGGVTQATIHATVATMEYWKNLQLVERVGNVFYTANDSIVIADAGYDGSGPEPAQPAAVTGAVWAYITPDVQVRLGPIETIQSQSSAGASSIDNLTTVFAERLAAATFESPCDLSFAVAINHPVFTT